jgi:hypothetical protein
MDSGPADDGSYSGYENYVALRSLATLSDLGEPLFSQNKVYH